MGGLKALFWLCVFVVSDAPRDTFTVSSPSVAEALVIGGPQKKADWATTPSVRICSDSGVSFSRASQAIRYWEMLGYDFDDVRSDVQPVCREPYFGEIVITLPDGKFENHHIAATRLYTQTSTGKIVKAKIQIFPKSARKERVLEHEIGHALGWSHYSQRFHMMHPAWLYGGFNSKGLRKHN